MTKAKEKVDQLAIDAAAARAAGLSYGKWRAMQSQKQIEPKPPKECYIKRACPACGVEFIVSERGNRKKYCSEACKQRVYARAKRERAKAEK